MKSIYESYEEKMELCLTEEDIRKLNKEYTDKYGQEIMSDLIDYIFMITHY